MGLMGGGFFGSGASSSETDQTANTATHGQDIADDGLGLSLSNLEIKGKYGDKNVTVNTSTSVTDHGSIEAATNLAYDSLDASYSAISDTLYAGSDSLENSAGVLSNTLNLGADILGGAAGLVTDVITVGNESNLEYLGEVSRFSELAAQTARESAEQAERQAQAAMAQAQQMASQNAALAADAIVTVGDAYSQANTGLLAISSEYGGNLATLHDSALLTINQHAQAAQDASLKAIDYVFESGKSESERTTEAQTKWLIGGVVVMAAMPVLMRIIR